MKLSNVLSFLTIGVVTTVVSAETSSQVFLRGAAAADIITSDINNDASSRRLGLVVMSENEDITNSTSSSSASEDEDEDTVVSDTDSDSDTSSNSTSMSASEDTDSSMDDMMNMTSTTGASVDDTDSTDTATSTDTSTSTDASTDAASADTTSADASADTTSTGSSADTTSSTSTDASADTTSSTSADNASADAASADTSTSASEDNSSSSDDCTTIENTICAMEDTTVFCDILQNQTEINLNVYSNKYTMFVPTDDAFSKVEGAFEDLTFAEAARVIGFHIYRGIELTSSELVCGETITSIDSYDGNDMSRTKCEGGNKYQKGNGNTKTGSLPKILSADNMACNGVIHTLDYVMFPVSLTQLEDNNEGDNASSDFA